MPANLGMIALGKAKQLEKKLQALEVEVEEIKKQIREALFRAALEGKG